MIDAHCHLDLYPKPAEVIRGTAERRVFVIAMTTTPKAWEGNQRFVGHQDRIRVAVGLHPELVAEREQEAALLCTLIERSKYVGEVGLDGSPQNRASMGAQQAVLDAVLQTCAKMGGRVISLHSRLAATLVLDHIERAGAVGNPILHWFSGTGTELERAIELGCWFSVGPAMLSSKKGRSLLASMPPERVLTETDGPFGQVDGRSLLPWEVDRCSPILGSAWGLTPPEVDRRLKANLKRLVSENVTEPGVAHGDRRHAR